MGQENYETRWQTDWLKPPFLMRENAIKPAEIASGLCKVMLARDNLLEDANYNKFVPNRFVVEVSTENYTQHYQPIEESLIAQWRDRLVEHLMTANSRVGRKEYRFTGQIQIELRPSPGLKANQARVLSRVESGLDPAGGRGTRGAKEREEVAYLELLNAGRSWALYPGENTIGRDEACDIFLDLPSVQEKRLVSAQHAVIRVADGRCVLYDGAPDGRPSANGTYVNAGRVSGQGVLLLDGDVIILAALHPGDPRPDTPGVAAFRFRGAEKPANSR